jgi:cell wall-associated NlpC family hydrolase
MLALTALMLAGCASAPRMNTRAPATEAPIPGAPVVLTDRAMGEISSGRARELALHALSYVGVPYRYGGTSPETGFDCSGLVHYVYSRGAGMVLPRTTEALSEIGAAIGVDELETGDLVFFDTLRKPYSHVGIYLGDQRFIHAPTTGGYVELVDLRTRYWQSRFSGARRPAL